jgi:hypothetical protein
MPASGPQHDLSGILSRSEIEVLVTFLRALPFEL